MKTGDNIYGFLAFTGLVGVGLICVAAFSTDGSRKAEEAFNKGYIPVMTEKVAKEIIGRCVNIPIESRPDVCGEAVEYLLLTNTSMLVPGGSTSPFS